MYFPLYVPQNWVFGGFEGEDVKILYSNPQKALPCVNTGLLGLSRHKIGRKILRRPTNKNLAIANRSRVSCTHNMLRASMMHKYYTMTLKSRLSVTQGHWKRNHWIDHTRLSSSGVIWRWILLRPWNVG